MNKEISQQCPNCDATQQQGKFCGKCGTLLIQATTVDNTEPSLDAQQSMASSIPLRPTANVQVEKLKEISNGYFNYFLKLFKKPTDALSTQTSIYNLISFILYLLVISITIYSMVNKVYSNTVGMFSSFGASESISLKFILYSMIIIGIFTIVAIVALFLLAKVFVGNTSFSLLFGQVTNFYPALIVVSLAAFVLQLIGMAKIAVLVTIIAIFIALLFIPLYVIVHLLQKHPHKIDTFYIYLMLTGIIALGLYLVLNSMFSSIIDEMVNSFSLF